jgi:hypothetical protein
VTRNPDGLTRGWFPSSVQALFSVVSLFASFDLTYFGRLHHWGREGRGRNVLIFCMFLHGFTRRGKKFMIPISLCQRGICRYFAYLRITDGETETRRLLTLCKMRLTRLGPTQTYIYLT